MSEEQWRRIPGNSRYEVSDHGRVRSYVRREPRVLRPATANQIGHRRVYLGRDDADRPGRCEWVHRLVLAAFVGPCPSGQEVRHLDGDPANNKLENLAYGTRSENVRDMLAQGRHPTAGGPLCRKGHEYKQSTTQRWCPTCGRERYRLKVQRKRAAGEAAA